MFIAAVIWLLIIRKQNESIRKALYYHAQRLKTINSAIDDIVDLVVSIIDITSLNTNNEKRLALRIKECFLPKDLSSMSLLSRLPSLANVYRFGIIDYLKKEIPTLSSSDIEFFSLIVLGASPSAISRACGYDHPATLYNKRLKLRKKLNISSPETDLEEYILTTAERLKKKHDEGLDSLNKSYHI